MQWSKMTKHVMIFLGWKSTRFFVSYHFTAWQWKTWMCRCIKFKKKWYCFPLATLMKWRRSFTSTCTNEPSEFLCLIYEGEMRWLTLAGVSVPAFTSPRPLMIKHLHTHTHKRSKKNSMLSLYLSGKKNCRVGYGKPLNWESAENRKDSIFCSARILSSQWKF